MVIVIAAIIMKALTLNRDKFMVSGRSYGELLYIIDKEAFDWYESIEPDPNPFGQINA